MIWSSIPEVLFIGRKIKENGLAPSQARDGPD